MGIVVPALLSWALATLLASGLLVLVIGAQGVQRQLRRLGARSRSSGLRQTALRQVAVQAVAHVRGPREPQRS